MEVGLDVTAAVAGETRAGRRQSTTGGRSRPGTRGATDTLVGEEEEGGTPGDRPHKPRTTGLNLRRGTNGWNWNSSALATAHLVSTLIGSFYSLFVCCRFTNARGL